MVVQATDNTTTLLGTRGPTRLATVHSTVSYTVVTPMAGTRVNGAGNLVHSTADVLTDEP